MLSRKTFEKFLTVKAGCNDVSCNESVRNDHSTFIILRFLVVKSACNEVHVVSDFIPSEFVTASLDSDKEKGVQNVAAPDISPNKLLLLF